MARSFDLAASAIGTRASGLHPANRHGAAAEAGVPAVVTGELLDREGLNGIIVYDSLAFTDPWLAR